MKKTLSTLYKWFMGIPTPHLAANEKILVEAIVDPHHARWWQNRRGKLFLTNERLIFIGMSPPPLPRKLVAAKSLSVPLQQIESVHSGTKVLRAIFGSPGLSYFSVKNKSGDEYSFQTMSAPQMEATLGRLLAAGSNSGNEQISN
jgi:hypothetical protein